MRIPGSWGSRYAAAPGLGKDAPESTAQMMALDCCRCRCCSVLSPRASSLCTRNCDRRCSPWLGGGREMSSDMAVSTSGVCTAPPQLCWKSLAGRHGRARAISLLAVYVLQPVCRHHGRLCQLLQPVRMGLCSHVCLALPRQRCVAMALSQQLGQEMPLASGVPRPSRCRMCTEARHVWDRAQPESW